MVEMMNEGEHTKAFGQANLFYRARIITITEETPPEFDWSDEILFREPPKFTTTKKTRHRLQVLALDEPLQFELKEFKKAEQARRALKRIVSDLTKLSKKEFDEKHRLDELAGNKPG